MEVTGHLGASILADAFAKLEEQRICPKEVHLHPDDWTALQSDPDIPSESTLWGAEVLFDDTLVGEARVVGADMTVTVKFQSA